MISQRDIQQFFNVIEVLREPDKYKAELTVLENIRKEADTQMQAAIELRDLAHGQMIEAQRIISSQDQVQNDLEAQRRVTNDLATKLMVAKEDQEKVASQLKEVKRLLDEKEKALDERDAAIGVSLQALADKEKDYQDRMANLRANEKDYQERVAKLRQIAS